ncbi:MAG: deoxyhypusine synthase family protein, partial [Thaumarchaeota archaeon]|nr:deoxyhypusine synthase family protein [Nitrososphaerota archaeon]
MVNSGRPVKDISIKKDDSADSIFEQMSKSGGFESRNLADGLNILTSMIEDKDCLKFLSFVGAVVSTGLRGVITDMVKNKMCDVIITTCGALDHDIARHFSNYLEGSFTLDDSELADKEIHRLGNVLVPLKSYGPLIEEKVQAFLEKEYANGKKEMS